LAEVVWTPAGQKDFSDFKTRLAEHLNASICSASITARWINAVSLLGGYSKTDRFFTIFEKFSVCNFAAAAVLLDVFAVLLAILLHVVSDGHFADIYGVFGGKCRLAS
jgi:hypothetical protein